MCASKQIKITVLIIVCTFQCLISYYIINRLVLDYLLRISLNPFYFLLFVSIIILIVTLINEDNVKYVDV